MSSRKRKSIGLLTVVGAVVGMLVAAQAASAIIVRPNSATPTNVSMVLAYTVCNNGTGTPAGEVHNPNNLPGYSCTPPSVVTPRLTAGGLFGDAANFRGFIKLVVAPGNVLFPSGPLGCGPASPPATNCTGNYVQDVRCTVAYAQDLLPPPYGGGTGNPANRPVCNAAGSGNVRTNGNPSQQPDYTGSLNVVAVIRITDEKNSGPGGTCTALNPAGCTDDATVQDLNFAVAADCSVTPSTAIGANCLPRHASAQALCGCVANGKRSNIEVGVGGSIYNGGIFATDGGTDGAVADLVPDTDTPLPYSRQGVFIP